ncbi:hypothetical protein C8J56DRAFT_816784 [Mycena floridula]|nr:hypothetical protein C8J56DRAFT_816784 [Mycena floridula]
MASPFSDHLGTNFVPQAEDIEILQAICKGYRTELALVDDALRQAVLPFIQQRSSLVNKYDAYSALLSPIRRVPPEVLGEIFKRCVTSPDILDISAAPYLLTFVCSAWRRFAINDPRLWRVFCLTAPFSAAGARRRIEALKCWQERSAPLSLDIRIQVEQEHPPPPSLFLPVFRALDAERWRSISAIVTDNYLATMFAAMNPADIPALQDIQFEQVLFDETRSNFSLGLLRSAQSLQSFAYKTRMSLSIPELPLQQMTRIHLEASQLMDFNANAVLLMISRCPKLTHLGIQLNGEGEDVPADTETDPKHFSPALEYLQLDNLSSRKCPVDIFEILRKLEAPNLRTLMLFDGHAKHLLDDGTSDDQIQSNTEALTAFVKATSLRSLTLRDIPLSFPNLRFLLDDSPDLEELVIHDINAEEWGEERRAWVAPGAVAICDDLFLHLTAADDNLYLPKLKRISWKFNYNAVDADFFVPFLRSRTYGRPEDMGLVALKRFEVDCYEALDLTWLKAAEEKRLVKSGLELVFGSNMER